MVINPAASRLTPCDVMLYISYCVQYLCLVIGEQAYFLFQLLSIFDTGVMLQVMKMVCVCPSFFFFFITMKKYIIRIKFKKKKILSSPVVSTSSLNLAVYSCFMYSQIKCMCNSQFFNHMKVFCFFF